MPVNTNELHRAVAILTDNQNMRDTTNLLVQAGGVVAASTIIGGLIDGQDGVVAGAVVGGLAAAVMTRGRVMSVGDIIRNELTVPQREQLVQHIRAAAADFQVSDLAILLPLLMGNSSVRQAAIKSVIKFLTKHMGLQLIG